MAPGRYRGINNRLKWEFKNIKSSRMKWNNLLVFLMVLADQIADQI